MTAGAVILAAGSSSRMAGEHKLLAEWNGKPLIAHVADAVAAAGLPPPVIVLGTRANEVRAALGGRPAMFVLAADHAEGLSRSLRAGIAAVPNDWSAALICLADMPRVEAALIAALSANAAPAVIAVPVHDGRRGNPVLWGRNYLAVLMACEGDSGGRRLLDTYAGHVVEVAAPSDAIHTDIDTVHNLRTLRDGYITMIKG